MTQLVWVRILLTIILKNFTEVGCLALGFSGIGRAGFPKTRWPPIFPTLCTLSAHFQTFKHITVLSVYFLKHNFQIFCLPAPEGIRNLSLVCDFTEARTRRNRPKRTGLDHVYVLMDVRTTENRARDVHLHNTNMTVPMIVRKDNIFC